MQNIVDFDYVNQRDKELTKLFISPSKTKKYILGINKLTRSVQKHLKIDGIIDNTEWANAVKIDQFVQREPDEGKIVSEKTEVFLFYDKEKELVFILYDK